MQDVTALKQKALLLFRSQQLDEAKTLFEQLLTRSPRDLDALNLLSAIHGMKGDYGNCETYCRKAIKVAPKSTAVLNNLGNALKFQGKTKEAEKYYRKTIKIDPRHSEAYGNLGVLYQSRSENEKAEKHYKKALDLNPQNINALNNLGSIYQARKDFEQAMNYYRQAESLNPSDPNVLYNIATLLSEQHQQEETKTYLNKVVSLDPGHARAWTLLGSTMALLQDPQQALACYRNAVTLDPGVADYRYKLGMTYKTLGDNEEADKAFEAALEIDPNHDQARFFLSTIRQGEIPKQAPEDYIASLFDGYAEFFDEHLVKTLGYHTPTALRECLDKVTRYTGHSIDIMDLGCGTGLSGASFADLAKSMTGVDLSSSMIEKARQRGIYNQLLVNDIVRGLQTFDETFDLVICVDSFIYIGDLGDSVKETYSALKPGGLFAFSTELAEAGSGYDLTSSGRYAHSEQFIKNLLERNGFRIRSIETDVIRKENHVELYGQLFIAEKH